METKSAEPITRRPKSKEELDQIMDKYQAAGWERDTLLRLYAEGNDKELEEELDWLMYGHDVHLAVVDNTN